MQWKKLGLIFSPDSKISWTQSHAMIPTPLRINNEIIRVFLTFCDEFGIGRPGFIDVLTSDPSKVVNFSKEPLLQRGAPGTFDENGVLVCSVVHKDTKNMLMYYVGFELGTQIRYRLLTGLALSQDNGNSFKKYGKVPVLERSNEELYFRCGPFCIYEEQKFKLWYVAGSDWTIINGKSMPIYDIRYLESDNGINWPDKGKVIIDITDEDEHGFGRPYVIKKPDGGYRMFFSIRKKSLAAYRLGYAESNDGINWVRMDKKLNLDVSEQGFDSEAIMYAAPIEINNKLYVFYNGNDFGRDGVALAVLESE
jgi:hypothetical protein